MLNYVCPVHSCSVFSNSVKSSLIKQVHSLPILSSFVQTWVALSVLDSSLMMDSCWTSVIEGSLAFINNLPPGCYVNIHRSGSIVRSLFREPRKLSYENGEEKVLKLVRLYLLTSLPNMGRSNNSQVYIQR